jgi:hypothetical protein
MRKGTLMKSEARKAMAVFGGAAALVFAVGLGGLAEETFSDGSTAATPTTSVTPAHSAPSVPGQLTGSAGPGVHAATLVGCVSGLDC